MRRSAGKTGDGEYGVSINAAIRPPFRTKTTTRTLPARSVASSDSGIRFDGRRFRAFVDGRVWGTIGVQLDESHEPFPPDDNRDAAPFVRAGSSYAPPAYLHHRERAPARRLPSPGFSASDNLAAFFSNAALHDGIQQASGLFFGLGSCALRKNARATPEWRRAEKSWLTLADGLPALDDLSGSGHLGIHPAILFGMEGWRPR